MGANFLGFSGICAFSDRRRGRRQRGASGDFVNLEDLSAQSSKMLIGGRRRGRRQRGASGDFENQENLPAQSSKMLIENIHVKQYVPSNQTTKGLM
ncbi:hypothetical protein EJB05_05701 [Eragrostis curvula]|uniref:Uncharacterized protein n=1 Tax=Eragrostis curvula TaxID=38414 RepID=A0A5J9WBT1_9POAL|nr:hypothetical protein EJB05_05701 [Eragrostis curvula]